MQKMVSHSQIAQQTPEIKIHYFENCNNFWSKNWDKAAFGSIIEQKQYCFFLKKWEKTVPTEFFFFSFSTAFASKMDQKQH